MHRFRCFVNIGQSQVGKQPISWYARRSIAGRKSILSFGTAGTPICSISMPPGKRQSPFIGKKESLEGILYPRILDIRDALLESDSEQSEPSPAPIGAEKEATQRLKKRKKADSGSISGLPKSEFAPGEDGRLSAPQEAAIQTLPEAKKKKKKKEKVSSAAKQAQQEEAPAAELQSGRVLGDSEQKTAEGDSGVKSKRKRERKEKKLKTATPSGPGNAEEAQQIRSVLGFVAADTASRQPANGFSFGFSPPEEAGPAAPNIASEHETNAEEATLNGRADVDAAQTVTRSQYQCKLAPGPWLISKQHIASPPSKRAREPDNHLDDRLRRVIGQNGNGKIPRRVFVGGMPFHYDEEQLRDYWSYCGEIESLDLMRFPDTGRFKGIAFITFAEEAGYQEALQCNGLMIDEHTIRVEPCTSAGPKAKGRSDRTKANHYSSNSSPAPKTPGYHVAYVGNVAFEALPTQLKEVFAGCEVSFVRLHTDKESGKSKGFAHVHFADEASLDRAIQYDGTPFMGRSIRVGYAQPKKQ